MFAAQRLPRGHRASSNHRLPLIPHHDRGGDPLWPAPACRWHGPRDLFGHLCSGRACRDRHWFHVGPAISAPFYFTHRFLFLKRCHAASRLRNGRRLRTAPNRTAPSHTAQVIIEMKGFRGSIRCGRRAQSSCGTGCFLLRFVYVRRARRDKITCIDLGYDDQRNSQPSSGELRWSMIRKSGYRFSEKDHAQTIS